jgi:hypothetical protein
MAALTGCFFYLPEMVEYALVDDWRLRGAVGRVRVRSAGVDVVGAS